MFFVKDEFNTSGQKVIERHAYVVVGHGSQAHYVCRNVYENNDMEFYVIYDGFIVTVEQNGEVWNSVA